MTRSSQPFSPAMNMARDRISVDKRHFRFEHKNRP